MIPASNAGVLTLSGAPTIDCLAMEVDGKVNGAGYTGEALDVAFVKDDARWRHRHRGDGSREI